MPLPLCGNLTFSERLGRYGYHVGSSFPRWVIVYSLLTVVGSLALGIGSQAYTTWSWQYGEKWLNPLLSRCGATGLKILACTGSGLLVIEIFLLAPLLCGSGHRSFVSGVQANNTTFSQKINSLCHRQITVWHTQSSHRVWEHGLFRIRFCVEGILGGVLGIADLCVGLGAGGVCVLSCGQHAGSKTIASLYLSRGLEAFLGSLLFSAVGCFAPSSLHVDTL